MPENIWDFIMSFAVLLIFFGVLDLIIVQLIRKNTKWYLIITAGVIYFAVIFFGFFFLSKQSSGQNVTQYVVAELNNNLDVIVAQQKKSGLSEQEIQSLRTNYDLFVIQTFPAWAFISTLFLVFLNYLVVRLFVFRKYGIRSELKSFELWYLNERVIWLIIVGLAVILLKQYIPQPWIYSAALNIVFVLSNIYFFIGMGILSFMLKKYKLPFLLRVLAYMGVIFFMYLTVLVVLAGVLDTWFNFRKIEKGGKLWK
jgi:uncharacterized protein YybS (DUF2232 family)